MIPNSVIRIGDGAFNGCTELVSVTISGSVTYIGNIAFGGCTALSAVYFQGNAPYNDGSAFQGNSYATVYYLPGPSGWSATFGGAPARDVTLPQFTFTTNNGAITITGYTGPGRLVIPAETNGYTVTSIGTNAFYHNFVPTSVIIPDSVTSIGSWAFGYCDSLARLTIGSGVTNIGNGAFLNSLQPTNFSMATDNPAYSSASGVLFDKLQTRLLQFPAGLAGSYVISDSIINIAPGLFEGCFSLTSVTIPDSVASLGQRVFYDCTNLTAVCFQANAPFHDDWGATFGDAPTVQWNPHILTGDGTLGVHAGHFGFTFVGTNNIRVAIEACSDLTYPNWTIVTNLTCGADGTVQFTDPDAADQSSRYYRFRPERFSASAGLDSNRKPQMDTARPIRNKNDFNHGFRG